jgi:hypothetical protein
MLMDYLLRIVERLRDKKYFGCVKKFRFRRKNGQKAKRSKQTTCDCCKIYQSLIYTIIKKLITYHFKYNVFTHKKYQCELNVDM